MYFLLLSLSLVVTSVQAQEDPTYRRDGSQPSAIGLISPAENDSRIAQWLLIDQQAIVECSKMAQDRASNDAVKQFAKVMVTEHSACIDKLQAVQKASASRSDSGATGNPPIARAENAVVDPKKSGVLIKDPEGKQRDGKLVYRPTDFVKVKEDVCNHMKSTMTKEMKSLSGSEYDRAYMMHMVAGHEAMIASCKAVRSTASKEVQTMLDENLERLNSHAKLARQLCDQVSGKTASR